MPVNCCIVMEGTGTSIFIERCLSIAVSNDSSNGTYSTLTWLTSKLYLFELLSFPYDDVQCLYIDLLDGSFFVSIEFKHGEEVRPLKELSFHFAKYPTIHVRGRQ